VVEAGGHPDGKLAGSKIDLICFLPSKSLKQFEDFDGSSLKKAKRYMEGIW